MEVMEEKFDLFLGKWISRKFMVWLIATVLLWFGKLDGNSWMFISMIYLITQGVIDAKILIDAYTKK